MHEISKINVSLSEYVDTNNKILVFISNGKYVLKWSVVITIFTISAFKYDFYTYRTTDKFIVYTYHDKK